MEYNSDPRLTWREICRLIKGHILFYPLIVIFSLWSHFCVRLSSYSNNWASLRKRITVLTVVNCSKFPVCVANSNFVQQPEDDWSGLQRSFGQESPGQVQVSLSFKTGLTGFTQCFFFSLVVILTLSSLFPWPSCVSPQDSIGDLKKLIAAQTGTRYDKIVLKKW